MDALDDKLGQVYAGALIAIARVDSEINPEESSLLRNLVANRSKVTVDFEETFFHKITPEELAAAVRTANASARDVGRAFVQDAVALSTADGDLNGREGEQIIRFARALGLTRADVTASTNELDEWLGHLH